jgi:hypothetical protein
MKRKNMKTTDRLALALVVFALISRLGPLAIEAFRRQNPDLQALGLSYQILAALQVVLSLTLSIAIGAWLYKESKTQGRSPWVWFLLGLMFSLMAVVAFLLIPMCEQRRMGRNMRDCVNASEDSDEADSVNR